MMDRFSRENTLSDGNPSVGHFVELFVKELTNVITGKPYSKINSRRMLKHQELGLFGMLKLALQFIVTNAYFSVARTLTLVLHATLK